MILLLFCAAAPATVPARLPVLIDSAIGHGIGDAYALALALGSHELEVRGVTAVGAEGKERARLLCRFLTMTGRRHIRVAAGTGEQPRLPITDQEKYHYHPDPLFGRTTRPDDKPAHDFLFDRLKERPGTTIIALGPLPNIARLLMKHPGAGKLIGRLVCLAGHLDETSAAALQEARVPVAAIREEPRLDAAGVKRVFSPKTALTRNLQALHEMWDGETPDLAPSLAVARAFTKIDAKDFPPWYADRLASLVAPSSKPSKFVPRGMFPRRVQVAEDFTNDIERFWWMSGKEETKILPSGRKRACRAVLTHDFDDLLMPSRTMWKAVIFNPVPGPPMGHETRLAFRCWLKGTDRLRVQIYSLTNGYHRHLVLEGLPQGRWIDAAVDMTQARRPDGTGGPLGKDERIDDIQFYADADAELVVSDIVLHEAAAPGETRPFPKRIVFAGGFDTGTKEKHWPGEFDLVGGGAFWRAARSKDGKLTVGLRGKRALPARLGVSFRYRLTGAESFAVEVGGARAAVKAGRGEWPRAVVEMGPNEAAEEARFVLPEGAELLIDDLMIFEP
ncbi:MAG: nucleoside hydrolase [Gemmataceae bacterium]|nr:nucleoside hydrolase [Gemmataceae bacterium]